MVSTHFDDAALSVAHLLQRAGPAATVVTVCGGAPPRGRAVREWDADSGFGDGREAARRRALEDRRACAVTGARRIRLRHRDGPYRQRRLRGRVLRAAVERLLGDGGVLWLPAGIGGHPDHLDVRAALLPLARVLPASRVRVYADLPYAGESGDELPSEVAAALPGLRAHDVRLRGEAWERKLAAVRCHASQIGPLQEPGAPDLLAPRGVLARERFWRADDLGRTAPSRHPAGVTALPATLAPRTPALADGEVLLWRERRSPPFMEAAWALAALLALAGVAVASIVLTPLLAGALAAVLLGRRIAAGHYLEDQLLTDRRAVVVPRVGQAYGLPLEAIDSVELKGTRATFSGGGQQFRFAFVRRHRALRKALEDGAPHVSLEQRWDPNCAG